MHHTRLTPAGDALEQAIVHRDALAAGLTTSGSNPYPNAHLSPAELRRRFVGLLEAYAEVWRLGREQRAARTVSKEIGE